VRLFAGRVDDVRLFQRALSNEEIQALYLGAGPLLALPMDEVWAVGGTILPDSSGWTHDGILHTGAGDATNKAQPGQVGAYALDLDGADDYVSVEPHVSLDLSRAVAEGGFTEAAWVTTPPDGSLYPVLSSAAYAAEEEGYPALHIVNRRQVQVSFGDGTALTEFTTGDVLADEGWNHVAATFDGEAYAVYVNGAEVAVTDAFSGKLPAATQQFDVGRGAYAQASNCADLAWLDVTPHNWVRQMRITFGGRELGTVLWPTRDRAVRLPDVGGFCGPSDLQVELWSDAQWAWVSLGTTTLSPTPGTGDDTLSVDDLSATLSWRTTAPPASLRHWQGGLDDVRLYPRVLSAREVEALFKGGWQAATLEESGGGVQATSWDAQVPSDLEGAYQLTLRGWDAAGLADNAGPTRHPWQGTVDTMTPRVSITRTTVGERHRYVTVAEDFNLLQEGFSSPCGAGVASETESYQAPWYQALTGAQGEERLYRITADCEVATTGLFPTGAWTELPLVDDSIVVSHDVAYVPAGPLWEVDVEAPALPRFEMVYNGSGDGRAVAVSGQQAYVADGGRGLSVVDLSDPSAAPTRMDTAGTAKDVTLHGSHAYLADGSGGLRVADVSDPGNPNEVGHYGAPGDAVALAVSALPPGVRLSALRTLSLASTEVLDPGPGDSTDELGGPGNPPAANEEEKAPRTGGSGADSSRLLRMADAAASLESAPVGGPGDRPGAPTGWSPVDDPLVAAQPLTAAQDGLPDGLTAADRSALEEQIRGTAYHVDWRESTASYVGSNPTHGWHLSFKDAGLRVANPASDWTWQVTLTGVGYPGAVQPVEKLPSSRGLEDEENQVAYAHQAASAAADGTLRRTDPTVVEWYVNDERGLEQGFTIHQPPAQAPGSGAPGGDSHIQIEMALETSLLPEMSSDGEAILFRSRLEDAEGPVALRYGQLHVMDASGMPLPAHLELDSVGGGHAGAYVLRIAFDDQDATYPVTVDPLLTSQLKKRTVTSSRGFGFSVGVDGDTAVVGARNTVVGGRTAQGRAYVYTRNQGGADNWGLVKTLTAPDGAAFDYFGWSAAISGDTVVVGAPYHDASAADNQGAIYVFRRNQGGADNWGFVKKLTASDGAGDDHFHFGMSVAASGYLVVAGASGADVGGNESQGAAYVFARHQGGVDNWGQQKKLVASDGAADDLFGSSVSVSEDTAVVGAWKADVSGRTDQGAAYVYRQNAGGANNWGQVRKVVASNGTWNDHFGRSVSVDGETLVVGAADRNVGTSGDQGMAYVFSRNKNGANQWGEMAILVASDGERWDSFGESVWVGGETVVVGAPDADDSRGTAYVFSRNQGGGDAWGEARRLVASDRASEDRFGDAVAVDGRTIFVGAWWDDVGSTTDQGSVYIFTRQGNVWGREKLIPAPNEAQDEEFGGALALSGDTLVVADERSDVWSTNRGAVYVLARNKDGEDQWGVVRTLANSGGGYGDLFGSSVAIDGDLLVAGAWFADSGGTVTTNEGAVYVFARNSGGADQWGHVKKLVAGDDTAGDHFGHAVAISGDTVVVGAPDDDVVSTDAGAAYVFSRNQGGNNNWGQVKKLTGSDIAWEDNFGTAVAIHGDLIFVGSPRVSHGGIQTIGAVYVFGRNQGGANNWGQLKKLTPDPIDQSSHFGASLAVNGDILVVGARYYYSTGAAFVFGRNQGGPDAWGQVKRLMAADAAGSDNFGASVATDGDLIVVGSLGDNVGTHIDQGSAHVFARNKGGPDNWGLDTVLTAEDGLSYDYFGRSVAVSDGLAVVGADGAGPAGRAYVYRWTHLTAAGESYVAQEDTLLTIPAPGVLDNDLGGDGAALTAVLAGGPEHGDLDLGQNGSFTYNPAPNYYGGDSFSYRASDGLALSGVATATITVNSVNDPPVTNLDSYTTAEEVTLNVSAPGVLGNDGDPDDTTITAHVDDDPNHGTLTLNTDGSFSYEPEVDFYGTDGFIYYASDGTDQSDSTDVRITVTNVEDAPVAVDDAFEIPEDQDAQVSVESVLDNDADADDDPLTAVLDSPLTPVP